MYFHETMAEMCKARAGEPYRPSNGSEGMMFMAAYCDRCLRDENNDCDIIGRSMLFDLGEPDYPAEIIYGKDGQPTCTAFAPIEEWRREGFEASRHRDGEKGQGLLFGGDA